MNAIQQKKSKVLRIITLKSVLKLQNQEDTTFVNDGNKAFRDDKYFVYFHLCVFKMKVKVNIRDLGVTSLVTEREFNVTWGIDQQIEKRKNFNYFERIRHHFPLDRYTMQR